MSTTFLLSFGFCCDHHQNAEDKKTMDPALAGFYEAMERTNVEKNTVEMLVGLSGDSSDSDCRRVDLRPGGGVHPP
jgi:hypothetical protein